MAALSKITVIFILAISFALALLAFYIMSSLSEVQRRKQASEIVSQLINFVLFLWLAKILLKLPLFLQDPVAVLAYPANSDAFYLAALFTGLLIFYQSKKRKIEGDVFAHSLLQVMLTSLFVYEFVQLIWRDSPFSFSYLLVYGSLLLIFHLLQGRASRKVQISSVLLAGAAGFFIISFIVPYLSVFGYILDAWFLTLMLAAFFALLIGGDEPQSQSS